MQFPRSLIQQAAEEALKLPPHLRRQLRYRWPLWQLPHQVPPPDFLGDEGDTWMQIGGRGCGKNVATTQDIRHRITNLGVRRLNFIGRTAASIRDDMVRGEAGIIAAFPPHQKPVYISSQSVVRFHTGAEALLLSAEEPDAIQGKNAELTWCDEFSTYGPRTEEVWTQACFSTRVGNPRKYITTNSLPDNPFLEKLLDEAVQRHISVTRATSFDNFSNLPPQYQREVLELSKTAYGRAWVTGEFYKPEGALWKSSWFRYVQEAPRGGQTVVAIDPSGTTLGDETGIVVVRRVGDIAYVIDDQSGHHDPEHWPKLVVDLARKHGASLVIERNRGMDFLRALIRPLDRGLPIKEVNVDISKADRAYPVAHIYELDKVRHLLHLKDRLLERQLTTWDPKSQLAQKSRRKTHSPDRLDALVHGITALGFHIGLAKFHSRPDAYLPSDHRDE